MFGFLYNKVKESVWGSSQQERDQNSRKDENMRREEEITQFTGRVTQYDRVTSSGMIDHSVYFDLSVVIGGIKPQVGVSVHVQATRQHALAGWKATKVQLINQWQPEEHTNIHNVVGYVIDEGRTSCIVFCGEDEIVFHRNSVNGSYYPRQGDWVMLKLLKQDGEVSVTEVKPLRQKTVTGCIEWFTGRHGTIDRDIGFTLGVCQGGYTPREGDTVTVDCVECKHHNMGWRALKVLPSNLQIPQTQSLLELQPFSLETKHEKFGVIVSGQGDFGEVELGKKRTTTFTVINGSDSDHTFLFCAPVSLKDQFKINEIKCNNNWGIDNDGCEDKQENDSTVLLQPGSVLEVSVELTPKVLGRLASAIVFKFDEFRINLTVHARIIDKNMYLLEPSKPYIRKTGLGLRYQEQLKACSVPGQRPMRKRMHRLPHKLKQYPVPDNIRECMDLQEDITFVHPQLLEPLSWDNYQEYFSTLLYCEELQLELNIRDFDIKKTSMYPRGPYLALGVPGLAEGRPSLLVGDRVIVCEPDGDERSEHFEGFIHEVHGNEILMQFSESFHDRFQNEDYDIMFTFNRTPVRRMHQSVELVPQLGHKALFPTSSSAVPPLFRIPPSSFFNPQLNERQKAAVARILGAQGRPAPYVVFGPPGTGKTVTLVETILQVYKLSEGSCRILACAPSNSATDLIAEHVLINGRLEPGILVRLNALQRATPVSPVLLPHCMDTDDVDMAARHRIIVSTCVTAGILYNLALPVGHFTHVFVDEAGQATEPECLIPLGLLAGTDRQPVLAGDPHQLGPVLQSRLAISHGLGVSLLERLMNRPAYQRDETKFKDHGSYDPLLVTKLIVNYRSHESLLSLYSKIFYHNELKPAAEISLTHSLVNWEGLTTPGFPLLFHGLLGEDVREGNSPSWFNPVEAVQVVKYAQSILSGCPLLTTNDIGIITPYRKQVEKIRLLLQRTGLEDIKVGSVEEFQGQEKLAIIMSTVRSSQDLVDFDLQHNLGFLSNPKRFNVSISRAQALLVVVGNPNLLNQDPYWCQLLDYAIENGAYVGCPLLKESLKHNLD